MYTCGMKRFLILAAFVAGFACIFVLTINVGIYVTARPYLYASASDVPRAEAALILGASLLANGTPSSIFRDRADEAIRLYEAKKAAKILVSGDNSTVSHNEVNPVRNYLLQKGIPDRDIFLDHAGFDTYSSMYRARAIFGVSSLIIATQSFHLPRAVYIARKLGIEAYGVNADSGRILLRNYIREIFADEKAVFDLVFNTRPKYLGDAIPITGDGREYP